MRIGLWKMSPAFRPATGIPARSRMPELCNCWGTNVSGSWATERQ
jgi:hypothetical protein